MHIIKLLPEYMKLDLSLTRDIDSDPTKQALTAALVAFATQMGGHLIAEGVETANELDTLIGLGVEFAQGYFLGAPGPLPGRRQGRLMLNQLLRAAPGTWESK